MYFTGNDLDIISPARRTSAGAGASKPKKKSYPKPDRYYLDSKPVMKRRPQRDEFSKTTRRQNGYRKSKRQMEYELFVKKMIVTLVTTGAITAGAAAAALAMLFGHNCDDDIQTVIAEEIVLPIEEENDGEAAVIHVTYDDVCAQNKNTDEINKITYEPDMAYEDEMFAEDLIALTDTMPDDVSNDVIEALKGWETFRQEAYLCPSGKLTIGWGHTKGVYEGQTTTMEEAEEFLRQDIKEAKDAVTEYAKLLDCVLTQGQFDALTSFAYNCGINRYKESGVTELIAAGDIDGAANLMQKYVKGKVEIKDENGNGTGEYEYVVMQGLVSRRAVETGWLYK